MGLVPPISNENDNQNVSGGYDLWSLLSSGIGSNKQILKNRDYEADLDYYVDVSIPEEDKPSVHGGGKYFFVKQWEENGDAEDFGGQVNYTGVELGLEFENDDSAWIMACVFIIFTMQTGTYTQY